MMKLAGNIKLIFSLALLDGKGRRKQARFLLILTVLTLSIFLLVNSLMASLVEGINNIMYKPYGRVVSIIADTYDYEEQMSLLKEKYADDDMVEQVFWHIYSRSVTWLESDLTGTSSQEVQFMTAVDELEKYLVEGVAKPEQGQILVPKYLYSMGNYNEYTYADGSELLGKVLTFEVSNAEGTEYKQYSFQVAGVYDNVKSGSGNDVFCINEQDAFELDGFYGYRSEESIRAEMEEYNIPEEQYENMLHQYAIGFYISADYDLTEAIKEIEAETGAYPQLQMRPAGGLGAYFEFIAFLGNVIVFMLGITAVIVLVVTILRDLRNRRGQFALRYACGYSRPIQIAAYVLEKIWILGKACLIGILATIIGVMAGNYMIQHIVPFYMRDIHLYLHGSVAGQAICAVLAGGVLCILIAVPGIVRICPAETLKKEER